MMILLFNMNLE